LKEYGDKLSEGNKSAIETALAGLRTAHQSQDVAAIDAASEQLNNAWTAASTEMYNAANAGGAAKGQPTGEAGQAQGDSSANDKDVQDVNFEEVK